MVGRTKEEKRGKVSEGIGKKRRRTEKTHLSDGVDGEPQGVLSGLSDLSVDIVVLELKGEPERKRRRKGPGKSQLRTCSFLPSREIEEDKRLTLKH